MNNEYKTCINCFKCHEPDPRIGFFFGNEMKFSLMKLTQQFFQTLGIAMKTCMITLTSVSAHYTSALDAGVLVEETKDKRDCF